MNELDQWDNSNFSYARAALMHHFPEQAANIFKDLRAKYGARFFPRPRGGLLGPFTSETYAPLR